MRVLSSCVLVVAVGSGLVTGLGTPASAVDPGYTLSFLAGTGSYGAPTPGGPATSSALSGPFGVAVDTSGNVYVADAGNSVVEKVAADGTLTIVAGIARAPGAPTPGPATSSRLRYPDGVAVDTSGNVYIADTGNNVIEKVAPDGALTIVAGTGGYGAPTPGPATSSSLQDPSGVAVDATGNVYIADSNNHLIEKVALDGTLRIVAGTGTYGAPTPGPATSSQIGNVMGVAVDATGNLYIADTGNSLVEKVTPGGTLMVVAGTPGTAGAPTPGPATGSALTNPFGVAVDRSGNLYVADTNNERIEKVTPSGTLTTVAGTGTYGPSTPGPATSSQLAAPIGVAVDTTGHVFVADNSGSRIEKLTAPDVGTPTAVTVTAPSRTYRYGVRIPARFTPTYAGYAPGERPTVAPTCTSAARTGDAPSSHRVTCSGGVATSSTAPHTFTYRPGTVRIIRAGVDTTVTATPRHRIHRHTFRYQLTARLTNASTGAGVPDSVVTIRVGRHKGCHATTNSHGVARCHRKITIRVLRPRHYRATSTSTPHYRADTTTGTIPAHGA